MSSSNKIMSQDHDPRSKIPGLYHDHNMCIYIYM